MLIPIALGLAWPDRVAGIAPAVDWSRPQAWEFFPLDDEAFPAVRLAREAGGRGGTAPAVYNAANEECVAAFRGGRLRFPGIVDTVAEVLDRHLTGAPVGSGPDDLTLDDVLAADAWARDETHRLLESHR
jgi:1-deoxy-D-xylulose-5-phosphate reductoisomerase